jgi:hypothetical protein
MSMFRRAMRRTRRVLLDKLEAVEFPYLNKVALNSRPNSYAMFFGRHPYSRLIIVLGEQPFTNHYNPFRNVQVKGKESDQLCQTELNTLNFIGHDFQKANYRTMMTEDWALGTVDWPNCIGFKRSPADHFMRPFWLRLDGTEMQIDRIMRRNMFGSQCLNHFNYDLSHALMFADSYRRAPKFAISWVIYLAHDNNELLFQTDPTFAKFLEELSEKVRSFRINTTKFSVKKCIHHLPIRSWD